MLQPFLSISSSSLLLLVAANEREPASRRLRPHLRQSARFLYFPELLHLRLELRRLEAGVGVRVARAPPERRVLPAEVFEALVFTPALARRRLAGRDGFLGLLVDDGNANQ